MNDLCKGMLLIAFNALNSSISDSNHHTLECFHDEEQMMESMLTAKVERDNVFWQPVRMSLNDIAKQQQHSGCDGSISLCQLELVNMSTQLCDLIYEDCANVSNELVNMMLVRLVISDNDEPVGAEKEDNHISKMMSQYEGELYLRRLYHAIHEQSMVVVNDDMIGTKFSDYTGSRQHCTYWLLSFSDDCFLNVQ